MLSKHILGEEMIWFREEKRNKKLQEKEKIEQKNRRARKMQIVKN